MTAQQLFKELESGKWKPFYLILGEEPFQAGEILERLRNFFLKDETSAQFNYEAFDGEHLDAGALVASLDTLPGLFGGDGPRLIYCSRFDKVGASQLEIVDNYFKNPSDSTCLLLTATKADKRKSWVKAVEEKGGVLEVNEPHQRDWPRWQNYFEKRLKKKIEGEAWEALIASCSGTLSMLWSELQKAATFVGDKPVVTLNDVSMLGLADPNEDVFALADDVLCWRAFDAMRKFQNLLSTGENEIKMLSLVVRQFRLVAHCMQLTQQGITDSKTLAPQLGTHPFFIPRILGQSRHQTPETVESAIHLLAECDYRLKTGEGGMFEHFFVPYFQTNPRRHDV